MRKPPVVTALLSALILALGMWTGQWLAATPAGPASPPPLGHPAAPAAPAQVTGTPTPGFLVYAPHVDRVAPGAPSAPFLSYSGPNSAAEVSLTWTATEAADAYFLWRSFDEGMANAELIYTGKDLEFTTATAPGVYYYVVQAVNEWGATPSNRVSVLVPTPTPRPTATPSTSTWVIRNNTGGSMTIEIIGYGSRTFETGVSEWVIPCGTWTFRASARCGSLTETYSFPCGGRVGDEFYCRSLQGLSEALINR